MHAPMFPQLNINFSNIEKIMFALGGFRNIIDHISRACRIFVLHLANEVESVCLISEQEGIKLQKS